MSNWRELGRLGDWLKIDIWKLLENGGQEFAELRSHLRRIVPKVIRDHGHEIYEDRAFNAFRDLATAGAAQLLSSVESVSRDNFLQAGDIFTDEINLAKATLLEENIEFFGMTETYIYRKKDGKIGQLRPDIGEAVVKKRIAIERQAWEKFLNDPKRFLQIIEEWSWRYPWRQALSLEHAWRRGYFPPNTQTDHAIHIFDAYDSYQNLWHELAPVGQTPSRIGGRHSREASLIEFSRCALIIGTHAGAVREKLQARHAMRRKKQIHVFAHENEGRNLANAARRASAEEWRGKAREIAKETELSGMGRARWVQTLLQRRHGITKSVKTIAKVLSDK